MFGGEAPGLGLAGTSSGDEEDHGRGPVQGLHHFAQPVRDAALRAGGEIVLGPDGKGEGLPVGLRQVDQAELNMTRPAWRCPGGTPAPGSGGQF